MITMIYRDIIFDIYAHLNPETFLKKEFHSYLKSPVNIKALNRTLKDLQKINQAHERVLKYPLYFSKFYPDSIEIDHYECLEYHVHAFLNDIIILKEKIRTFLISFSNDFKEKSSNSKEFKSFYKLLVKETVNRFRQVDDLRNSHNHSGKIYQELDLIDCKAYDTIKEFYKVIPGLKDNAFLDFLEIKGKEGFKVSQDKRVKNSEEVNKNIIGILEAVFGNIKPHIYKALNINGILEILKK